MMLVMAGLNFGIRVIGKQGAGEYSNKFIQSFVSRNIPMPRFMCGNKQTGIQMSRDQA